MCRLQYCVYIVEAETEHLALTSHQSLTSQVNRNMSLTFIGLLVVFNVLTSAYWFCEAVELSLACNLAMSAYRNRLMSVRVFGLLFINVARVLITAILATLAVLEIAAYSEAATVLNPLWTMYSTATGMSIVLLGIIVSPRFREEIVRSADGRISASRRATVGHRRWSQGERTL